MTALVGLVVWAPVASAQDGDGDGVPDATEAGRDTDMDGEPDNLDIDDDGDGIPTIAERPEGNEFNIDGDALPDFLDPDDDGDLILTIGERPEGASRDTDVDGIADHHDPDDDGDGLPTAREGRGDLDMDGMNDWLDRDADGDGYFDGDEDLAGVLDAGVTPMDADSDLLPDPRERNGDTDDDGTSDVRDEDDDGDSVPTRNERPFGDRDTDGDGVPNQWDTDDDGDGILTILERRDGMDGDRDFDDVPDYLDSDVAPLGGGLAGGGGCTVASGRAGAGGLAGMVLLTLALGLVVARRRRGTLLAAAVAGLVLGGGASASAQPMVTLDQYHPAATPDDGFVVERPVETSLWRFGAHLTVEYANDPLVYETDQGDSETEVVAIVSDHLVTHANFSMGFGRRVLAFAHLPMTLIMDGEQYALAPQPEADGANIGDLSLGGRFLIAGGRETDNFGIAAQFALTMPTHRIFDDSETWVGERRLMGTPKMIGEFRVGAARLTGNVGFRFRSDAEFGSTGSLRVTDEFIYAVGAAVPVGMDELTAHVELFGSTDLERSFERETSNMEVLGGVRFMPMDGFMIGAVGGAGLLRGYGSPDFRVGATVGFSAPPEARPRFGSAGELESEAPAAGVGTGGSRTRRVIETETEVEVEVEHD